MDFCGLCARLLWFYLSEETGKSNNDEVYMLGGIVGYGVIENFVRLYGETCLF